MTHFGATPHRRVAGETSGVPYVAYLVDDVLGEGPLWHPLRDELYWFDISGLVLRRLTPRTERIESLALSEPASAAGWRDRETLLIARGGTLQWLALSGLAWREAARFPPGAAALRPNDGRCDPWGRFWIGTMCDPVETDAGTLYWFQNGRLDVVRAPITVPNALAFSHDRARAYFADSPQRTILALELDPLTGTILGESPFASIAGRAVPDGAVVDAEGCLWNAEWDGGRVVRYRPDGAIDRVIDLPVSRPTCPAFGGPDLRTLYVTSARYGLSEAELENQPLAGSLLALDLGIAGCREYQVGA